MTATDPTRTITLTDADLLSLAARLRAALWGDRASLVECLPIGAHELGEARAALDAMQPLLARYGVQVTLATLTTSEFRPRAPSRLRVKTDAAGKPTSIVNDTARDRIAGSHARLDDDFDF